MGEAVIVESRAVFSLNGSDFTTADVLDSAWVAGKLEESWPALLQGIANEEAAVERALQPETEWLQAASEEFRYERDLLTVEETERWLEDRQISTRQFNDYFVRLYWREHLENAPETEAVPYPAGGANLHELFRVQAHLSGDFEPLARSLAWRLLVGKDREVSVEAVAAERRIFLERVALPEPEVAAALRHLGRDEPWMEAQLVALAAYRLLRQQLTTPDRLERSLVQMRLPLTRVEFETVRLPSEDAAREAMLCLRENEVSITELAEECGQAPGCHSLLLDDCPEDTQRRLICAIPGDVFGPDPLEEGFVVYRLVSKTDPSLENPETRSRIESRLLDVYFSERMLENVQWLLPGCA
jgi:hypothetical protein